MRFVSVALAAVLAIPLAAQEPVPIFNGRDLDGWTIHGTELWYVENGELICESGPDAAYGYLRTEAEYRDFELTLEFKQEADGNSGVFFRSTIDGVRITGWQAEVAPPGLYSGGIYESYGRGWLIQPDPEKDDALRMGEWNRMRVRVVGDRVTTWINGHQMINLVDAKIGEATGHIALQIHDGGGIKVRWRNLEVKRFDDSAQTRVVVGPNLRVAPGEFNEPWIAASPENPDFLVAVTQNDGLSFASPTVAMSERHNSAFLSRDGGGTWQPISLPGYEPWSFDPMVVPGPDGRMWIMYSIIGQNAFGGAMPMETARPEGRIMVWSTDDEGATWVGPAVLRSPVPPDHPRIAADWTDGPHRGRLYVVWNDVADSFLRDEYQVFLHTVDDAGGDFSEPRLLAQIGGGKLVATEPVVLSDGTLVVSFYQYFFPLVDEKNATMPFFTMRSTDGGETFTEPEVAFRLGRHSWAYAQGEIPSAFTLPIVAWDRSGGSHADNVYVVWDHVSDGTSDIWFRRSTDGARSWSPAVRLNDNPPPSPGSPLDDRMIPVVEVDGEGTVAVAWYDRRNDASGRCWELFFTASVDGGETFLPNVPVDTEPSCPPPGHAPALRVHNVASDPEAQDVPEKALAEMSLLERLATETVQGVRAAQADHFGALDHGRLEITFDNARGAQPGHYLGLAADAEGVFHPLWITRRNGIDELYSTTVSLMDGGSPSEVGPEEDVTAGVLVVPGAPSFDPAGGTVTFDVHLRNVSDRTLFGPVRVESTVGDDSWSFQGRLGSHDRLAPGVSSEPVRMTVEVGAGGGRDVRLDFRVLGRRGS